MSFDIDMQSYAGAAKDPAAVGQSIDPNSYQSQGGEFPVNVALLNEVNKEFTPEAAQPQLESNPQSENFRALREEVDRIKTEREAEKRDHQLQLEMLRANLAQSQMQAQPKQPEPQAKKMFEGMADDDVPNVSELRREWAQRESDYQSRLEELQVQQSHPDYAEVIEKFVLPLIKQKPHLAEGIQGARNKALYAYELGKMAQATYQPPAPVVEAPKNETAQRIVENARKPGTLSQAGGQGALSQADYFASMSDQDFMKFASKNLDAI